jgi:hypothetical protein
MAGSYEFTSRIHNQFSLLIMPAPGLFYSIACLGHGALVNPLSRNAIDNCLPPSQRTPVHAPSCSNLTGHAGCDNGQSQYWYSQGCFIGCPECDHVSGRRQSDICGLGKVATINDPKHRTVNRAAPAGSELDIYKHNPWRAPGAAPVADSCGLAGGTPWAANVSEWGDYVPTIFAKHGDKGSKLPANPTSTVWSAGGTAEVVWQIGANHGGGYQYRLCPLGEPLTEECFQRHPLDFEQSKQALIFANGSRLPISGTFVTDGTLPMGSTWALNPIPPRCLGGSEATTGGGCSRNQSYPNCLPCPGTAGSDCTTCDNTPDPSFDPHCEESSEPGLCSGNMGASMGGAATGPTSVVDTIRLPRDLMPGAYVLGWRLDCEATAQVWTNCADVTISR